ncbi:MAG: hypothetical protein ACYDCI_13505 [Candidatus Limnocylindrales bacterium]
MGWRAQLTNETRRTTREWRAFGQRRHATFLRIGLSAAVVSALVSDGLTIPLLLALGTHPAIATIIGVLPVAGSAAQLRIPWLLDRTDGDLRRITLVILGIGETRGFWLAAFTLLGWAGIVPTVASIAGIGLVMTLGGAATTIGGTNLLAWYGAILPDPERRFVAPRVMGLTVGLGAILLLPVALLVQVGSGALGVRIYAFVFALAGIAGIVELLVVRRLPRPGRVHIADRRLAGRQARGPQAGGPDGAGPDGARRDGAGPDGAGPNGFAPRTPGLEPFIRSIAFAAFGAGLGPYLSIYAISVLHLSAGFAILLSALSSGAALAASTIVGGMLARGSASRTLRVSFLMRGGSMLFGMLAFPGQPLAWLVICIVAIVASAGASAATLASNERLMRLAPGPRLLGAQGRFVAANALGMTAGQVANGVVLAFAPLTYATFAGLFLVSGLTRFIVAARAEVSATWATSTAVFGVDDLIDPRQQR